MIRIDVFSKGLTPRLIVLSLFFLIMPLMLLARLWYEQVRSGPVHQKAISRQSIRHIRLPPIRGNLFARDGTRLTDNRLVYDVQFHVHEMRQPGRNGLRKTIDFIINQINHTTQIIDRKHSITEKEIKRHINVYPALPFTAFRDLSMAEHARLSEAMPGIPGLEITTRTQRMYPLSEVGAHLIGFVGRRDPNDESDRSQYSYFLPEHVGRTGLERLFNGYLRGEGGVMLVRVDSMGFFHQEVAGTIHAQAGQDIVLTLDARAQAEAQKLLHGISGAFVVLDCRTGAVLAMASSPTYDLNGMSGSRYSGLAGDSTYRPLLNRAISGGYAPGSIIKPLVAMRILADGAYGVNELVSCNGAFEIGDTKIRCAHQSGHGAISMVQALESSCNPYFIGGGVTLGLEQLQHVFRQCGIGANPRFELSTRGSGGTLPSRELKWRRRKQRWNAFDTALISIGQGMISVSPLQAAVYTAAIANRGTLYRPYIVDRIQDRSGQVTVQTRPEVVSRLDFAPWVFDVVHDGMHHVVHGGRAGAPAARTPTIELAGKTGTAEVGFGRNKRKNTWFICFGPYPDPRYAVAVLVEGGVSGGRTAAPLARRFFDAYLGAASEQDHAAASRTDRDVAVTVDGDTE